MEKRNFSSPVDPVGVEFTEQRPDTTWVGVWEYSATEHQFTRTEDQAKIIFDPHNLPTNRTASDCLGRLVESDTGKHISTVYAKPDGTKKFDSRGMWYEIRRTFKPNLFLFVALYPVRRRQKRRSGGRSGGRRWQGARF